MEWIVALLVFVAVLAAIPLARRSAKRSSRAKGFMGGSVMALGLAFWAVLNPPAKTATEEIEKNKGRRHQETADGSD